MTIMEVPQAERGHARLFAVDLPPDAAADWGTPENIAAALGTDPLPEAHVEYFPTANLEGLGLAGYMVEGLGMKADDVRADLARINAVSGHVLIVLSGAVRGRTLSPRAPLRWIGTYSEPVTIAPMDKLHSDSARGVLDGPPEPKRSSDAAMSGRIATIAILVLLLLVLVMVLIA